LRKALDRLIQLYEATGRPDQAAKWKQKRDETEHRSLK
jgi:GH15 family glucan-1,4-alpha-glucosidase